MALSVGEVAVDFVANLDDLFKSLEKLGKKLDEALSGNQEVKVSFDDRIVTQIDKIADGVEKISTLTERFRTVAEGVFDLMDGKIGNTSEQIEKSFGGAIKGVGDQTDDFITTFVNKITKGVSRLNPLVLGQLFGATLLVERLVAGGFKLTSILPKFLTGGAGIGSMLGNVIRAVKTLNLPFLLGFFADVSQSLLSVTTVVALLTTGLRGLTTLTLRFLGRRPETQVQKFVVLLETLNAGLTDMLAKTRIFIEKMFFITSFLTSIAGLVTIIGSGVSGLTAVVSPFLALTFVGISAIRFASAKVSDLLLRLRASAGDGRAQTTLFLRALRSLFPILDAIAKNAKPIARMINQFAKGGFEKRMKKIVGQFQQALTGISRIDQSIRKLAAMMETTSKKVIKQLDQFISKADALFQKIGRQGARDALASIERVRSSATKATKEVQSGLTSIAPAAQKAEQSASRLGARLVEMGKRTLGLVGKTGVAGGGSLLGLMLFGSSGGVAPFLSPLSRFRDKLLGGFSEAETQARATGEVVQETFSSGAAEEAVGSFFTTLTSGLGSILDAALELSKRFWSVFIDPNTITAAFGFAGQTIAGLAPLLAVGAGAVLAPLVLRGVKNLTSASAGVIRDAAVTVWPVLRKKMVEPVQDFLLWLPRKVKTFSTQTVPDAVNSLTARVFKGTMAIGDRVKQFFGLAEFTEEQAGEKAVAVIREKTLAFREQQSAMQKQLDFLHASAKLGDDELTRMQKRDRVQDKITAARARAVALEKKLAGGTVDPEGVSKKLAATRQEIKTLAMESKSLNMPFREVQKAITDTEVELRSLADTMANELSQEAIQKLTEEMKANSRPIRSAIARVGIDVTTAFASGLKGTSSLVKAMLVSPFSSAATKRNLKSAASNLGKSFRSAFSVALRIGGGIAKALGFDKIGSFLSGKAGTTAGITAGTPEEEAKKRKVEADKELASAQEELANVLRAEKVVAEASLNKRKIADAEAELQINNQKLMSGQMKDTEAVLGEMAQSFTGLAKLSDKLEAATRDTAARIGGAGDSFSPADFHAAIDLAREIEQNLPTFKQVREQFNKLADVAGFDAKEREARSHKLDQAENRVRNALEKRVDAIIQLTGQAAPELAAMRKRIKQLEGEASIDSVEVEKRVVAAMINGAEQDEARAKIVADSVAAGKRAQELRLSLAGKISKVETDLVTQTQTAVRKLAQSEARTEKLKKARDDFADKLEQAAKSVNSAAFAKFTKEINKQQEILSNTSRGSKAGKEAAEKLARANENRNKVVERATVEEKQSFAASETRLKRIADVLKIRAQREKEYTRSLRDVSQVMLASREGLSSVPAAAKGLAATLDKISKTSGTAYVSTLAKQVASGEELVVFTDLETKAVKEHVNELAQQKKTLEEEEKAARELLSTVKSSAAAQKKFDKALETAAIREEQFAKITGGAVDSLEEVKVAEDMAASAMTVQEKATLDATAATREMSTQARAVAGSLEKAKVAIDESGQAMQSLSGVTEQSADKAKASRPGVRTGQGDVGQLRDLFTLLLTANKPGDFEKAPLAPARERAKNAPELRAIDAVADSKDDLQVVLRLINEIGKEPSKRVKNLSDNFSLLNKQLKLLQENPERMDAFAEQFSGGTIQRASRIVGFLKQMVATNNKLKVEGSGKNRTAAFDDAALRVQAQLIEKSVEGEMDFDEIPKKMIAALKEIFPAIQKLEFGGKGQKVIASELQLAMMNALGELKGRLGKAGNFGETVGAMIESGRPKAAAAAKNVAQEIANYTEFQSPPRIGPLRDAMLSMRKMGSTMGQQMLLGVNALKELTSNFMRQGFEGLLPSAFNAGAAVSDKFVGGIGRGLSAIGGVISRLPIAGKLAAIPLQVAGAITKSLGMITAGIFKMGAQVSGAVTGLVKEVSTKLLKLGLDATRLRLDPNNLQRFNEAMGILGGSASDAESGLQQLTQSIEQVARGSAPELERAFAEAGLAMADLQTMESDKIFLRVAQAANQASGDIRKQSDLLRLIGADFSSLRGVVLQGGEAIADAFERANKNPPISAKTLELGSKFTGIMSQIEQTIERIKLIIFEELAPILNDALETFGKDSRTQVDFILEHVRTGVRIVIKSITLIANFVKDRYIDAADGGNQLFTDLVTAANIAFSSLDDIIAVLLEKGVALAIASFNAIWASLSGQSKSALAGLVTDGVAAAASLANLILSPFVVLAGALDDMKQTVFKGIELTFLNLINLMGEELQSFAATVLNPIIRGINETLDFFGSDTKFGEIGVGNDLADQITKLEGEIEDLTDFSETTLLTFFEKVKDEFDKTEKDIEEFKKVTKDAFDIDIAKGEVDAFLAGIKHSSNEAERLRETIAKLNKEGILDTDASGMVILEDLRKVLTNAARQGLIPPGTITEGTARLRREAIAALGEVADETGKALKKAFEGGFDKAAKEFPEILALLEEIGVTSQRELDATATRLVELRKSHEKLNKTVKENLRVQTQIPLELLKQRRLLDAMRKGFDLRNEIATMTDSFVSPFTNARREIESLKLQSQEKILELKEFFSEANKTLNLDEQLEQTRAIAQQLGLSTHFATVQLAELEEATLAVKKAQNEVLSADAGGKAQAKEQLRLAQQRLKDVKDMSLSALGGLQDEIGQEVAEGFEDGMRVAASKPIVNILRTNLVEPVLGAFKDTIKGLVDGTLVEAAREAEAVAEMTGQKFSRALFIIADFGKRIFETAFDNLLETTFNNLTEGLSASIQDAFKDAEGAASGLGDAAGAAIAAAIQAAIALAGLILSRLQSEVSATEEAVENIVDSTEAIRGVISGSTTVAIKEAEDAFRDAQRPIVVRLDTIINLMRSAISGGSIPQFPLSGAGSTSIP